jgi:hypothetical protein
VGLFSRRRRQQERLANIEAELDRARAELERVIREESEARAAEISRLLARERADSLSRLQEEERRIAEERRRVVAEQESRATAELTAALMKIQQGIEQRLASWAADLERTKQSLTTELEKLRENHQTVVAQAEERIHANRQKIDEAVELQAAAFAKLREELEHTAEVAVATVGAELEAHAAEGRRTVHELNDRLKARDRRIAERLEREELDIGKRIQARLTDIERRQLESLERTAEQASRRYAEASALQFDAGVKSAREEAARRLARELDRAVHMFTREAERVLAEQLAQVAKSGTSRVEKRLAQATMGLEQQRDDFVAELQRRLAQLEIELRERFRSIAEEAEAERAVLELRLQELARRADEALSRS